MSIASDYMHQSWCANWRGVPVEEVAPEMVEILAEEIMVIVLFG